MTEKLEHIWMTKAEMKKMFPTSSADWFSYCKRCGRPNTTKKDCEVVEVSLSR